MSPLMVFPKCICFETQVFFWGTSSYLVCGIQTTKIHKFTTPRELHHMDTQKLKATALAFSTAGNRCVSD